MRRSKALSDPEWETFGKAVMKLWPEGGVDGFELQELAEKHKIILPVPGGFDPDKHTDDFGCAEAGCSWFELNYK